MIQGFYFRILLFCTTYRKVGYFFLCLFGSFLVTAQEFSVPVTNRKFKLLVDESLADSVFLRRSFIAYRNYLDTNQVLKNSEEAQLVKKVGNKMRLTVEKYLNENNQVEIIKGFKWEFNLIDAEDELNAWCLPGGKMAICSGILPLCEEEDDIAVIIGHEVAHAIANHSRENISREIRAYKARKAGRAVLSVVQIGLPIGSKQLIYEGFKAYTNLDLLRYSRSQELEADIIGMKIMVLAGYKPENAITFWKRMSENTEKKKFNLWATHPSDEQRIKNLEKEVIKLK